MTVSRIAAADAPAAVGPYSQAVSTGAAAGSTVYISGQVPLDPATGALVEGGVEAQAERRLLSTLPDDLRPEFVQAFSADDGTDGRYVARLVKAADKLSALIKCLEERAAGNTEFATAEASTLRKLEDMRVELPEVDDFMEEFLPSYGSTLDQLL